MAGEKKTAPIKIRNGNYKPGLVPLAELDDALVVHMDNLCSDFTGKEYLATVDGFGIPITYVVRFGHKKVSYVVHTKKRGYTYDSKPHSDEKKSLDREGLVGRDWLTSNEKKFAYLYAQNFDAADAYIGAYNTIADRPKALAFGKRMLRKKVVKDYVDKLTKQALLELDIDHGWVLNRIKNIADGDDNKTAMVALKELVDILEMKNKITRTEQLTLPISNNDMKLLLAEKAQMLLDQPLVEVEYSVVDSD